MESQRIIRQAFLEACFHAQGQLIPRTRAREPSLAFFRHHTFEFCLGCHILVPQATPRLRLSLARESVRLIGSIASSALLSITRPSFSYEREQLRCQWLPV